MPFALNGGVRIRYEVEGSGPPLLLHIGFVGSLEDWADAGYVAALRDAYRLVLLDPRGQGQSEKPLDPSAYSREQRIGDVLAVLDAEGVDRVHFLGYSLGGWIALALGVMAPERIASLVIGGAHPFQGNPRPAEGDVFLSDLRRGMAALVTDWEAADPNYWVSPGERARWLAADSGALIAARLTNLTEPDLPEAAIAGLDVPSLLYVGSLDNPEPVERTARLMPNARYVALEGLDHAQAFGRSDVVVPYLRGFLG